MSAETPGQPPRPKLPKRSRSASQPQAATWLALVGLTVVTVGMIGVTALAFPQITLLILLVGAFGMVFVAHYFVWGIWLDRSRSQSSEGPEEFWRVRPPEEPTPFDTEPRAAQDEDPFETT